jgi:hypothetical protein
MTDTPSLNSETLLTPASTVEDERPETSTTHESSTAEILAKELAATFINDPEDVLSLRARWKEAVAEWEKNLLENSYKDSPNRQAIARFQSWQDLLTDLRKRQEKVKKSLFRGLIDRICPYLRTIHKLFPFLLLAIDIPESSKEVTLVWAVLYLGIDVSSMPANVLECS